MYFGDLADRVRAAFRDEYLTPTGRIVDESATAYALAITFDLVDGRQLTKAGDRLTRLVTAAGHRISTGFAGTPHITHAQSCSGHIDQAYLLLMQKECPSFLYPVTMGATTTWERWDAVLPDGTLNSTGMTSLNHYAFGAVADWLHRVVGGIEPAEAGYRRLRIAPRPGTAPAHLRPGAERTGCGRKTPCPKHRSMWWLPMIRNWSGRASA